jgi:uncharacterized surface protein with fasciclin (FAS1) repeats
MYSYTVSIHTLYKEAQLRQSLVILAAAAVAATAIVAPVSAAPAAPQKNIVQVAASSPQFSTLVSLLKKAGLAGSLQKGNYTVFAPTNAAFARLPTSTLAAVAEDKALLKTVLTYHVVKGKVPAAEVVTLNGKSVKTLAGQNVKISVRAGKVFLNGTSRVTKTDVMASNGIIHVVNRVLIPKR